MTLEGAVERRGDDLVLVGQHAPIRLAPLTDDAVLAWDRTAQAPRPATPEEHAALGHVSELVGRSARVTGAVTKAGACAENGAPTDAAAGGEAGTEWALEVRVAEPVS